MSFKLVVVDTSADSFASPDTFVFHKDRVIIGRDMDNDLPLPDERRIVSKQHAEIVQQGDQFQVQDLGSKNFTYLNGERLKSGQLYPLQPGDVLKMGDFEINLEAIDAPQAAASAAPAVEDQTVFDASFVNPFEDGAQLLAAALRDLGKNYRQEAPNRRDDALQEAVETALDAEGETALEVIARLLGTDGASPPESPAKPSAPSWEAPSWEAPSAEPAFEPPEASWSPQRQEPLPSGADTPRLEQVLDVALQALAQLVPIPWQFRHEFIGQTIMHAEGTSFLYEGEAALKRHLLDPSVSEAEAAERLHVFEEAVDDVARHLVALLDGYKAGVQEGAQRLIDQLHPDALVEEAAKGSMLNRLLPPLAKAKALDQLREQLQELRREDWTAAERRAYRPAFIKAYLARMTGS